MGCASLPLPLQSLFIEFLEFRISILRKLLLLELLVLVHLGYQHLDAGLPLLHGLADNLGQGPRH